MPAEPAARAAPPAEPVSRDAQGAVAAVRQSTEAVLDRVLPAMFDAMGDLARTEAALMALARAFAPPELARLRAMGDGFQGLADAVEAQVARSRGAAQGLEGLMRTGRGRLDDLRRLTRSASLVALNAQVVSGAIRADGGALDGLARTMREVLAQLGGLVAELARGFDRGEGELARVAAASDELGGFAGREAVPAIQRFAALVEERARDRALARSAELVSNRLGLLQARIRTVVTHLQAGDGFRQRLEHVEAILARAQEVDPGAPAALLRRLAARQLGAAAADLGQALQEGRRNLRALGRTSGAIPEALARGGFRGGEAGGLAPLVRGARGIESAVDGLARTGRALAEASDALSRTLGGVGAATRAAAEFETRMTVLGLNAILLSSRMGSEGRAMVEVAQQLRDIARGITELIARLRQDTEAIAATAAALALPEEAGPDAALDARLGAAHAAAAEVSLLASAVGAQLEEMAATRSAAEISQAFGSAEGELEGFAARVLTLGGVVAELDPPGAPLPPLPPEGEAEVAALRRLYTTQAERTVHDALFPHLAPETAPVAEEDDILFG